MTYNFVRTIITLKNKFILQTNENILLYDYKTYQLIAKIFLQLSSKIFLLKQGELIGKNNQDNFAFIINPVSCKIKKYYFFNSKNYKLALETSNKKIIMISDIDYKDKILIYSKINQIYILVKIIDRNISKIYQFQPNS